MLLRPIAAHVGEENGEDSSTMHSLCCILIISSGMDSGANEGVSVISRADNRQKAEFRSGL